MSASLILVVEDDANLAGLIVSELRLEGYAVEAAADGITGLQQARSLQPDLILLDWMLPRSLRPRPLPAAAPHRQPHAGDHAHRPR
ncbi:MAG: response regulator [Cyanobium sp.]